jgi:hypothetical protein
VEKFPVCTVCRGVWVGCRSSVTDDNALWFASLTSNLDKGIA